MANKLCKVLGLVDGQLRVVSGQVEDGRIDIFVVVDALGSDAETF